MNHICEKCNLTISKKEQIFYDNGKYHYKYVSYSASRSAYGCRTEIVKCGPLRETNDQEDFLIWLGLI